MKPKLYTSIFIILVVLCNTQAYCRNLITSVINSVSASAIVPETIKRELIGVYKSIDRLERYELDEIPNETTASQLMKSIREDFQNIKSVYAKSYLSIFYTKACTIAGATDEATIFHNDVVREMERELLTRRDDEKAYLTSCYCEIQIHYLGLGIESPDSELWSKAISSYLHYLSEFPNFSEKTATLHVLRCIRLLAKNDKLSEALELCDKATAVWQQEFEREKTEKRDGSEFQRAIQHIEDVRKKITQ